MNLVMAEINYIFAKRCGFVWTEVNPLWLRKCLGIHVAGE